MKAALIGAVALLALGASSLAPAVAEPTQADWRADSITVGLNDPDADVRLEASGDNVPGRFYEQAELASARIVIKRVGRTPQIKLTFHAEKVFGPEARVQGHRVLQSFGVDIGKTPDLIHTVGFSANNYNERIQTFKDLEPVHNCRGARRSIDTTRDVFTITLPLSCLKWTDWKWGRISAWSVIFVRGDYGKGVDDTDFTRALPLTAK
ncbi:hypothetical protein F0U44_12015 [Nocardioides humilatus]|uniref:Uncharacterized protein n=1 Tax=Nocardioides humilatus TaxID=2607660 RepID=A0A5B1LHA2_9ACTN|nr:hypothetical protein [Nocardioides humilatus]KAA1419170.1 hypothetical protein F0U44_12015 [Nocardioides humilatus]